MRISPIFFLLALLALAPAACLQAAQASDEQIQRALEMLRTIQSQPAPAKPEPPKPAAEARPVQTPTPAPAPLPPPTPAPPSTPVQTAPAVPPPPPPPVPGTVSQSRPLAPTETLTPDMEKKAREVLSTIEAPAPPMTDAQREEAIRQAVAEANRMAEERRKARGSDAQSASEIQTREEINQVESEILKAKGQQPPATVPVIPAPSIPPGAAPAVTAAPTTSASPFLARPPQPATMVGPKELEARALLEKLSAETWPAASAVPPIAPAQAGAALAAPVAPSAPVQTTVPVLAKPAPVKVDAPPIPLTKSKQDRLTELLQAYRNDQISSAEYHRQRSKILGEP